MLNPCFNPRTRVGCDVEIRQVAQEYSNGFNPRTRVGCDLLTMASREKGAGLFQSTHPRGVRRFH